MYQIDNATSAASPPSVPAAGTAGYFTNGVPSVTAPTTVEDWWLNMVQTELVNIATMDGASLDKTDNGQCAEVLDPIRALKADASDTGSVTTSHRAAVMASASSTATNSSGAFVAACNTVTADGSLSALIASQGAGGANPAAGGTRSAVIASLGTSGVADISADADSSAIIASEGPCTTTSGDSRQLIGASISGTAVGENAAVLASDGSSTSGGSSKSCAVVASTDSTAGDGAGIDNAFVAASDGSANAVQAGGDQSAVIASTNGSYAGGNMSLVAASDDADATATRSAAFASLTSRASAAGSMVVGSRFAEVGSANYIGGGASAGSITFSGSDQNLEWKVDLVNGQIYADNGTITTPADYAEAFENAESGEIPVGSLVMRDGTKVRAAVKGGAGSVLGIVSATPALVGNASAMAWTGRHLRDEWGRRVTFTAHFVRWPKTGGLKAWDGLVAGCPVDRDSWPASAEEYTVELPKLNPDYDPAKPYVDRTKRPEEWTVVGLLGQLRVRVAKTAKADDWIGPGAEPGVAERCAAKDSRIQLMEILAPFDAEKGYAIGLALVR